MCVQLWLCLGQASQVFRVTSINGQSHRQQRFRCCPCTSSALLHLFPKNALRLSTNLHPEVQFRKYVSRWACVWVRQFWFSPCCHLCISTTLPHSLLKKAVVISLDLHMECDCVWIHEIQKVQNARVHKTVIVRANERGKVRICWNRILYHLSSRTSKRDQQAPSRTLQNQFDQDYKLDPRRV